MIRCPLCGPNAFVGSLENHLNVVHGALSEGEVTNLLIYMGVRGEPVLAR